MNYLNHYLLEDDASNVRKKWIICSNKVLFLYTGFETCAKFQLVKANLDISKFQRKEKKEEENPNISLSFQGLVFLQASLN